MFDFFDGQIKMIGNLEERMVDRYETEGLTVSTVLVYDGVKPYETAIKSPMYNNDEWIVVQNYDSKEEAQEGHNQWVSKMTSSNLPDCLEPCTNSFITQMLVDLEESLYGERIVYPRIDIDKE